MTYWTPGQVKTAKLHIPATEEMAHRLEAIAKMARISKAEAARRALERGLPSVEREIKARHTYYQREDR